jgi:CheY-like chemotaxis protein
VAENFGHGQASPLARLSTAAALSSRTKLRVTPAFYRVGPARYTDAVDFRAAEILLIEDNPMDVDLTFQAFREHAVANPVLVCRDGEEALDYINAHDSMTDDGLPILVLLDLRLPKVDGVDVLRHARSHPVWKQVPVVVLTTSRENRDISAAYELGINSYIIKPVDFLAFTEVVKTLKVYWLLTNVPPYPPATAT